jgi:hypothetical protein
MINQHTQNLRLIGGAICAMYELFRLLHTQY